MLKSTSHCLNKSPRYALPLWFCFTFLTKLHSKIICGYQGKVKIWDSLLKNIKDFKVIIDRSLKQVLGLYLWETIHLYKSNVCEPNPVAYFLYKGWLSVQKKKKSAPFSPEHLPSLHICQLSLQLDVAKCLSSSQSNVHGRNKHYFQVWIIKIFHTIFFCPVP